MNYFESKEDYLERILMLSEKNNLVRAIDIATSMNFSKPSVSIALKKLKAEGFILVNETTGNVTLTEAGMKIAKEIYERHKVISTALMMIGVSEETALEDACKVEHNISRETFTKIKEFISKAK
ncbi:MAG: iron dependent repressor, metal binding and dimerization domain protein [Candidatus Caccosoma sp.]|nr:iron dependent repressor, metal binding and dimerization domain protein [Candidatus Caccosoma sp.]